MTSLVLDERFGFFNLTVASTNDLFDLVGGALRDTGFARESYPQALKDREARFPTGLPVSGGVAIPHTDAGHVLRDTIAVATLAEPIAFGEMGGPDEATVMVSTVFMLALTSGEQHLEVLSQMISCIQNASFIDAVRQAESGAQLMEKLAGTLNA